MPQLIKHYSGALITLAGLAAIWLIIVFPVAAFGVVLASWSMMRWPHPQGIDQFNVGSAKSIGDALYEGLWAGVLTVGAVVVGFELTLGLFRA